MKNLKLFIIIVSIVIVFTACKSNDSIKTSNSKPTEIVNHITPTIVPTATLVPTTTPKPKLTGKEKANILYGVGKKYKNNNSASVSRDEFDDSVSVIIPSTSSHNSIEGDNSESIKVMPYIYHSAEKEDDVEFSIMFHCTHESLSFPEEVYIISSKDKMTFKLTKFDPEIEAGYVIESSIYIFKDVDKISKFKNMIKSKKKIRIRLSGENGDDIDFTLNNNFRKYLLDGIDLYFKADKLCN